MDCEKPDRGAAGAALKSADFSEAQISHSHGNPADIGVIFDWDGVIVDSSRQHKESWERLALAEGHALPQGHFVAGFGKKNEWIIPNLLRWTLDPGEIRRLSLRKELLYREIVLEQGLSVLPGVHIFLERLQQAGVPCCVGSSTHRENITHVLPATGLGQYLDRFVTAEDVSRGKPDPEVFLKAAMKTGHPPGRCVVFEDAFAGIEAARAGKIKVIGVATTHPVGELKKLADHAVMRLDELVVSDLLSLVQA